MRQSIAMQTLMFQAAGNNDPILHATLTTLKDLDARICMIDNRLKDLALLVADAANLSREDKEMLLSLQNRVKLLEARNRGADIHLSRE